MAINLQKGQRISLSKESPGLSKLICGLGWDIAKSTGGGLFGMFSSQADFDLDASIICVNDSGKLVNVQDVVYFGNKTHHSGAIVHNGDNLTGAGDGDDEQISIELQKIPALINKLVVVVNIYDCVKRKQAFGQVQNAFVRLVDAKNNREIAKYNLSGKEYTSATGMIMAEIYRHNNEWKMAAMGNGFNVSGLHEILEMYV